MNADALIEAASEAEEASFEMANLRPKTTGLPFVVFVSQKGGARHDVRVKISANPRALPNEMVSIPLRPEAVVPPGVLTREETALLRAWVEANLDALVGYWTGDIAYTEDLLDRLQAV